MKKKLLKLFLPFCRKGDRKKAILKGFDDSIFDWNKPLPFIGLEKEEKMSKSKTKIFVYKDEKVYTFFAPDEKGLPESFRGNPYIITFLVGAYYYNGILENANGWRIEDYNDNTSVKLVDERNEMRKIKTVEEMFAIVTRFIDWKYYDEAELIITRHEEMKKFALVCLRKKQENRFYVDKEVFEFAQAVQDEYDRHKPKKGDSWKSRTIEELETELLRTVMHLLLAKDTTINYQTKRFHKSVDAGVHLMMLYNKYGEE